MALTPDGCKAAFKEAMRPIAGANVDRPEIDPNFGALGAAVLQILTAQAAPYSDNVVDAAYWRWVADAAAWMTAMASWQQAVAKAFSDWAPTQPDGQSLKTAIGNITAPGVPPTPPSSLAVKIR